MRYPDSVEYLYALGNEIKSVKFGLENIIEVLKTLGNPQDAFPAIHVAGTNGKGSTCAMIEAAAGPPGSEPASTPRPIWSSPPNAS